MHIECSVLRRNTTVQRWPPNRRDAERLDCGGERPASVRQLCQVAGNGPDAVQLQVSEKEFCDGGKCFVNVFINSDFIGN